MAYRQMIERKKGVAVWRQIADDLQAEIAEGQSEAGQKLPTEKELADRYAVNRHTVRRAIAALANDGYVTAERGRGTFVAKRMITYPITEQTRFSAIVSSQDLQPGGRMISSEVVQAEGDIAEKLGVKEDTPLLRLEMLRVAEARPVTYSVSWFPQHRVPDLITDYAELGSVTKALTRAGFADYRRKTSWISTSAATDADTRLLQLEKNVPVLVVESLNVSADGAPLQFARARFAGDLVQLMVEN